MNTKDELNAFFSQPALAVVGVSRSGKKFGNLLVQDLKKKGFKIYPVHPEATELEGERCYADVASLPKEVGSLLISVAPAKAEAVVQQAHEAGIRHIFLQQGSESPAAIEFCKQNGISVISGHCAMMFPSASGFHKPHRWFSTLTGKLPR